MSRRPRAAGPPDKVLDIPVVRKAKVRLYDKVCFGLGTLGAMWLAVLLGATPPSLTWASLLAVISLWAVLAYLALPRLNRIMTAIYVPDYFIGRTRTSDGLLGDPLNLAVRGTGEQLSTAMSRAGWILADPVTAGTSAKIVQSTLTRRSYPRAPVSPLFLFDRSQDAAYQQEVEGNPAQRHHVRFWRTPQGWPLPGGAQVDWLAGGTYDRRVGLSLFTLQITHKIDADIDVERDYIVDSVTAAEPAVSVDVLPDFTTSYHSRNGGGDSVHTDGDLPVLDVRGVEPDPEAPNLRPAPPSGVPLQVWLPAAINLLVAPFVVWSILVSWPDTDSERALAGITVAGSVVIAVMALSLFARSAVARRVLLAVSAFVTVSHISGLALTADSGLDAGHTLGAMVAILMLVALSSPKATDWTTR
ncbi:MAG: LssY C-terminal domain-containing protein [Nocardioides sp.]|nr:LssY C-terminal domain-containing protein [Nocardioides sp.]